jgi:hypothetical protein
VSEPRVLTAEEVTEYERRLREVTVGPPTDDSTSGDEWESMLSASEELVFIATIRAAWQRAETAEREREIAQRQAIAIADERGAMTTKWSETYRRARRAEAERDALRVEGERLQLQFDLAFRANVNAFSDALAAESDEWHQLRAVAEAAREYAEFGTRLWVLLDALDALDAVERVAAEPENDNTTTEARP